jgi:hypothetical protein
MILMDKKSLDFAAFLSTEHMLNGIGLKERLQEPHNILHCHRFTRKNLMFPAHVSFIH